MSNILLNSSLNTSLNISLNTSLNIINDKNNTDLLNSKNTKNNYDTHTVGFAALIVVSIIMIIGICIPFLVCISEILKKHKCLAASICFKNTLSHIFNPFVFINPNFYINCIKNKFYCIFCYYCLFDRQSNKSKEYMINFDKKLKNGNFYKNCPIPFFQNCYKNNNVNDENNENNQRNININNDTSSDSDSDYESEEYYSNNNFGRIFIQTNNNNNYINNYRNNLHNTWYDDNHTSTDSDSDPEPECENIFDIFEKKFDFSSLDTKNKTLQNININTDLYNTQCCICTELLQKIEDSYHRTESDILNSDSVIIDMTNTNTNISKNQNILNKKIIKTKCNHYFHYNCLKKYYNYNNENKHTQNYSCPLCKKKLELDTIIDI